MKNKITQTSNTSTFKNFTSLSKRKLQIITGGQGDPTLSRGTKTSIPD